MNRDYLIRQVELYCRKEGKQPSDVYEKLGILYQSVYGVNIVLEMEQENRHDITQYLEDKGQGFIDRYIGLLNM